MHCVLLCPGALEGILDSLLNASPFDPPGDPTPEQQQEDLAAESAAAAAWRLQQRYARGSNVDTAAADAANAGSSSTHSSRAPTPAAAVAVGEEEGEGEGGVMDPSDPAVALRNIQLQQYQDRVQLWQQWGVKGWSSEDYLLGLQHWLLNRYSSSGQRVEPSCTGVMSSGPGMTSLVQNVSPAAPLEATVKRMTLCAGDPGGGGKGGVGGGGGQGCGGLFASQ
jgi:hypothetical protein